MVFWETADTVGEPEVFGEYAEIWRSADKVVYSHSLDAPSSERTRIERTLDPDAVRQLKASAPTDLSIGGAEITGQALRAGLVDELHLFLCPVIVGGGKPALPNDLRLDLELLDERRFDNGVVHVHYRVQN